VRAERESAIENQNAIQISTPEGLEYIRVASILANLPFAG